MNNALFKYTVPSFSSPASAGEVNRRGEAGPTCERQNKFHLGRPLVRAVPDRER